MHFGRNNLDKVILTLQLVIFRSQHPKTNSKRDLKLRPDNDEASIDSVNQHQCQMYETSLQVALILLHWSHMNGWSSARSCIISWLSFQQYFWQASKHFIFAPRPKFHIAIARAVIRLLIMCSPHGRRSARPARLINAPRSISLLSLVDPSWWSPRLRVLSLTFPSSNWLPINPQHVGAHFWFSGTSFRPPL